MRYEICCYPDRCCVKCKEARSVRDDQACDEKSVLTIFLWMFVFELHLLLLILRILRYIKSRSQFERFPWNLSSKTISVRIEYGLELIWV